MNFATENEIKKRIEMKDDKINVYDWLGNLYTVDYNGKLRTTVR